MKRSLGSRNIVTQGGAAVGALLAVGMAAGVSACRQLDRFTTNGDHFEGTIVAADFVRAGIPAGTTMCMTFDANNIQESPGVLSTSDGTFSQTAMRSIPQLWNDPLSTYNFGEGRLKNLIYAVHPQPPAAPDAAPDGGPGSIAGPDPLLFVSLLESNDVEVRILRGAPEVDDAGAATSAPIPVFALFPLTRKPGPCTY